MNYAWLHSLSPHSIVLTPNSRLVRFLLRQYQAEQVTMGQTNLTTPPVLPISCWLEQCYRTWLVTTASPLTLLTCNQELFIWEAIIGRNENAVFQPAKMAQLCMQAYQFLCAANLALNDVSAFGNIDVATFINAANMFEQECHQQRLLSAAQLPTFLTHVFSNKVAVVSTEYSRWGINKGENSDPPPYSSPTSCRVSRNKIIKPFPLFSAGMAEMAPNEIYLVNFEDLSVQIIHLLDTLKSIGCRVTTQELTVAATTMNQLVSADVTDEILTMARWAKHIHAKTPAATITCIIPNLTHLRMQIQKTCSTVFFPKSDVDLDFEQSLFNISGGYSLAQAPMIKAALQILTLDPYVADFQTVSILLASPWIAGYATECHARAMLDAQLRNDNEPELSWQSILKRIEQQSELAQLTEHLTNYLTLRKTLSQKQGFADWPEYFIRLLTSIGWPSEHTLSSEEYQQVQRWYELWHEIANVELQPTTISYSTALSMMSQYTQKTLFQKETVDGPIQILGLLEAAGQTSDYLWVMGLDSETWPERARPNPFLPRDLQRQHHMPHSSPERELHFSQQLMHRFQHSAQHVLYSYHQYDGERELSPSPLLKNITSISVAALQLSPFLSYTEEIFAQHTQEHLLDEQAPSLQSDEFASGGSGIFKDQAACPFRAFAHYRLKARRLSVPEMGLDALERGKLLHCALEQCWATLKTHARLCQSTENELYDRVVQSIEHAFKTHLPYSRKISTLFKKIEVERLARLLMQWLNLEKQRPAFTVVAHEQWRRVQVGQLHINVQIDRIDELENGERLLLDYKSGKTNPAEWFSERPRAPQLPLYAITEPDLTGLAFAQVRIDELGFKGISAQDLGIADIKLPTDYAKKYNAPQTWQTLLAQWHATLTHLADDFYQGKANVDPLTANTCADCDLHALCRITEHLEHA